MKKKFIVDIIMLIIMLLLMSPLVTGQLLHEIGGIILFFLLVIHLILNTKIIKNFVKGNLNLKYNIIFIIDILVFISSFIMILTGVFISQKILTNISFGNYNTMASIHNISAYLSLILMSIHLGIHYNYLIMYIKRIFNIKNITRSIIYIYDIIVIIISIFGVKALVKIIVNKIIVSKNDDVMYTSATTKLAANEETLESYLSKLYCDGCGRHCPLSRPSCSRGESKRVSATNDYYSTYSSTTTVTTTTVNTTTEENNVTNTTTTTSTITGDKVGNINESQTSYSAFLDALCIMVLFSNGAYIITKFNKNK